MEIIENYEFQEIVECTEDGMFDDEYVYDIEMADNHSFIANDILVHNSTYCTFKEVYDSTDYKGDIVDFVLQIYNNRFAEYIDKCFNQYALKWHTINEQALELESISYSALLIAKKKYILDLAWKEPGIRFEEQSKISPKGVEIIQSSTPIFARTELSALLKLLFKLASSGNFNPAAFVEQLKDVKKRFELSDVENISPSKRVGDYEKYIAKDDEYVEVRGGCPFHVKGAGVYNYMLRQNNMRGKYQMIKSSDKVRYYYSVGRKEEENAFSYQAGSYPYEFAPAIDYDTQFTKCILDPLNRFVVTMGHRRIMPDLVVVRSLF